MEANNICPVCGGFGCNARAARGLARFCETKAPAARAEVQTFGTYQAAAESAAALGLRVLRRGASSLSTGAPRGFRIG